MHDRVAVAWEARASAWGGFRGVSQEPCPECGMYTLHCVGMENEFSQCYVMICPGCLHVENMGRKPLGIL